MSHFRSGREIQCRCEWQPIENLPLKATVRFGPIETFKMMHRKIDRWHQPGGAETSNIVAPPASCGKNR